MNSKKVGKTTTENYIFDSSVPNDSIDIYGDVDITIRNLKGLYPNELRIEIEGKCIDYSIINALRRTAMMSIPIYAFHRSNVFIETDKSKHMYNNDLLYNQLETMPIFDIPNYYDLVNPSVFLSTEVMKNLFGNFIQDEYTEDKDESAEEEIDPKKKLFKIELYLNVKNNNDKDLFITSHHTVLKIDGKISNSYKMRRPFSIIVLKPTEEISLKAEANLGISKMHAMYEATTNIIYEELSPTKFLFWYETLEQLDKNIIFTKTCIILVKKLQFLKKFIKETYTEPQDISKIIEIQLYGEDHTVGNLIATALQKCVYVEKAAYTKPHHFIDQIIISYKLFAKSKKDPITILIDTIKYIIRVFEMVEKKFIPK